MYWKLTITSKPAWGLPFVLKASRGLAEQAGPKHKLQKQGLGVLRDWPGKLPERHSPHTTKNGSCCCASHFIENRGDTEKSQAIPSSISWKDDGLLGSQQQRQARVGSPSGRSTAPSHQGMEYVHLLPVQLVELLGQTVERGLVIIHLLL